MKLTLISSQKIQKFIECLKMVKNLSSTCSMYCNEHEIYMQTLDGSHISLLDVKIKSQWFDDYTSSNENLTVNADILIKILSLYIPKTKIELFSTEKQDKFNIRLIYPDNIEKHFEIPLIDLETELLRPDDNDYEAEFTMKTRSLDKYVSELLIFGESVVISCRNDNIYFKAVGTDGQYKIKVPHDNLDELVLEEDLKMKIKIDLKYISYITKMYSVFKTIKVCCDMKYPIRFYFDDNDSVASNHKNENSNSDDEDVENTSHEQSQKLLSIVYYIAPKMEDNDDDEVQYSDDEDDELNNIQDENVVIDE